MVNFSSFRRGGVSLRSRTKSLTKSYAAQSDKVMSENWDNGFITDEDYVSYLQGEVAGRAWLTPSQKTANTIKVSNVQERITETAFNDAYENGTISPTEYIRYKQGRLEGMTEGSLAYRNLQQDIYGLEDRVAEERERERERIVEEQERERNRIDAENKRLRNLQYSDSLLTISEWRGDTLSKAQGKVLALEGLVKDMEEYGDTVDDEGLPTKEYLSAQTRLNNAVETSGDLFRQHDQLRQELALNLSDLDTIPDLEGKRAIAEQMLQSMIDQQDEMGYLRVANRIATIDDSLRNAYESEYKRGLGQAEKMEEERIGLELRQLDEDMAELEGQYQSGDIDGAKFLARKMELLMGDEAGGRGYAQVLNEKAQSGAFSDSARYSAGKKLEGIGEDVNETASLGEMRKSGLVWDAVVMDKITGQETRKPVRIDPANIVDPSDPSAPLNLEDIFDDQGNFTGVYIRDAEGNLRQAQLKDAGVNAIKTALESNQPYTAGDLFEAGYLTVPRLDPDIGYTESRYNADAKTWDTYKVGVEGDMLIGTKMGGKAPFGSDIPEPLPLPEQPSPLLQAGMPGAETDQTLPVEERATRLTTAMEPAPAMTQAGVEVMKSPEYKVEAEKQIAQPWGQDVEPKPVIEYKPEVKYEVPDMPTYEETIQSMGIQTKAEPTRKAEEIIATMPYQKAVQTQAQKAVAAGTPYESTLAGWQEQQRKKKEEKKKSGGIFGKVKSFFGW